MYRSWLDRLDSKSSRAAFVVLGVFWCGLSFASEEPAPAEPTTLRAAIAEFAATYDMTVTGSELLGQEAPDWPANDQPPAAILRRLLSNYGYIGELRPGQAQDALPAHLTIVGASIDRADGGDQAKHPMPASLRKLAAQHAAAAAAANPSALTRSLTRLATGGQDQPVPAASTSKPPAPYSGLSGSAAPAATSSGSSGTDMAALTQAARASVVGLVTSLQNACGQGNNCR